MACKCFDHIILTEGLSLKEKLSLCKCKCNARFSAEENKQVFILADAAIEDVEKHKIDDGIIKDTINNKCDYLFVYKNRKFFFVELKGSDIRHALTQIKASMQLFIKRVSLTTRKICVAASSLLPTPKIMELSVKKLSLSRRTGKTKLPVSKYIRKVNVWNTPFL